MKRRLRINITDDVEEKGEEKSLDPVMSCHEEQEDCGLS
jgi:hypothetical protein